MPAPKASSGSAKMYSCGPVLVSPVRLAADAFTVIVRLGSATLVKVALKTPVMRMFPSENVVSFSLFWAMSMAIGNPQMIPASSTKPSAGNGSRAGFAAPAGATATSAETATSAATANLRDGIGTSSAWVERRLPNALGTGQGELLTREFDQTSFRFSGALTQPWAEPHAPRHCRFRLRLSHKSGAVRVV